MPDFAMCLGNNCPKKETCYRAIAEPDEHRQSYISPTLKENGDCDFYWRVKRNKNGKLLHFLPAGGGPKNE